MNHPATWPLIVAIVLLVSGGVVLLERAERQARDTTRKHHLEDIERALTFARSRHGVVPPFDEAVWCGRLHALGSDSVRAEIETSLREQNEQYANLAKPFPSDPLLHEGYDYFYWKRSPTQYELYAGLEAAPTGDRTTDACERDPGQVYDYGLASFVRERTNVTFESTLW